MRPEHWDKYTHAARSANESADPTGVAGRLLLRLPDLTTADPMAIDPARGGVIDVPPSSLATIWTWRPAPVTQCSLLR